MTESGSGTCYIAGFEDEGRGLQDMKCRWPLEAGKGKYMESPLEAPEGTSMAKSLH